MGVAWDTYGEEKGHRSYIPKGNIGDKMGQVCNPHSGAEQAAVRGRENKAFETFNHGWLTEAFRVLEPRGVLKVFGGTRTYHRLAAAMEEVGFTDIQFDSWSYSTGFPKSLNVGKAIDKHLGAERKVVGTTVTGAMNSRAGATVNKMGEWKGGQTTVPVTAPGSPEATLWDGWGTALKPAWEPVLIGVKPGGLP